MKLKTILFSAVLAATAGLGMGVANTTSAQEFECECYAIRYECVAQCRSWDSSCRSRCQDDYLYCRANCQPL